MDFNVVQMIAKGVIENSAACDGQLFTGKVTSSNPLKIKLGTEAGSIELDGDDIILTEAVVSKKLYIKKHTHGENEQLTDISSAIAPTGGGNVTFTPGTNVGTGITLKHKHTIETTVIDGWITEYGHKIDSIKDDEQICIIINRSLEEGDSVIMTRVSHGQQFVVLSRYFEVDKPGEDDEE